MKHSHMSLLVSSVFFLLYSLSINGNPLITITIDDYPLPDSNLFTVKERITRFIDIFDRHHCRVVFFCVGNNIIDRNDPSLFDVVSAAGHYVANHTMTHCLLSRVSLDQFEQEVIDTDGLLTHYPTKRKWFRFPGLDYGNIVKNGGSAEKKAEAISFLEKNGYCDGFVTVNTFDWFINRRLQQALQNGAAVNYENLKRCYLYLIEEWVTYYKNAYEQVCEGALPEDFVHTLLIHDNDLNALYIEDIIELLNNLDWSIVPPDKAFESSTWQTITANTKIKDPASLNCNEIDRKLMEFGAWAMS